LDELTVVVPHHSLNRARSVLDDDFVRFVPARIRPHGLSVLLRTWRRKDSDFAIFGNFTPVLCPHPKAVFIHDVIFEETSSWFTRLERLYLWPIPRSARQVDVVFTSSNAEAARIANPQLAGFVKSVGLGVPEGFRAARGVDPGLGISNGQFCSQSEDSTHVRTSAS
jgi:hypothetical protein